MTSDTVRKSQTNYTGDIATQSFMGWFSRVEFILSHSLPVNPSSVSAWSSETDGNYSIASADSQYVLVIQDSIANFDDGIDRSVTMRYILLQSPQVEITWMCNS